MPKKKETVRIIAVALKDREDAARVVRETVRLQLDMETAIAERDRALAELTESHNKPIDALAESISSNVAQLQHWADTNPEEFPKPLRSTKIDGHVIGWRLGNHQTKLLKGWTWAKVVAALEQSRKRLRETFLRVKTEANKEAMVERRARKKLLATFGVEIIQGETFYLEPNREGQADPKLQGTRQEVAA